MARKRSGSRCSRIWRWRESRRYGATRDAVAIEQLARAGRFEDAITLCRGDFFDGFHVDDVSPGDIAAAALGRMVRAPDAALTEELAREVAEREGAKAIVTGSVANVAGAFTVNVKIVSTERGDVLAAFLCCSSGGVRIQSYSRLLRRCVLDSRDEADWTSSASLRTIRDAVDLYPQPLAR